MNGTSQPHPSISVSLDNLLYNLAQIQQHAPPDAGIIAVVKDNAYGCGSVMIARTLEQNGVSHLAVAAPAEARALRDNGVSLPILVFGQCAGNDLAWGFSNNILFSLNDITDLDMWIESACKVRFHVAVDTGMGRLGILPGQAGLVSEKVKNAPLLACEGIYTHFAKADEPGTTSVAEQLKLFKNVIRQFAQNGIMPRHVHYANSAALLRFPLDPACTLVRPGITLYGCRPDPSRDFGISLKPVVSLKSYVVKTKRVPAKTPLSYGGTYVTPGDTTIATISLGYGIGLPRRLGNTGSVLIRGKRYTIAGRVTMDYIMADVGPDTDILPGDEAVAIGCQGSECITADDIAASAGTIGYEILCGLSSRLDRYYYLGGKVIHHLPGYIY
jgi:alanine racemase